MELAEQEMSQFEAGSALDRIEMSQNLRNSLQRAINYAHDQFHRQVTLEHLLLALVEDRDAEVILEASSVNVPALLTEISDYLGRLEDRTMAEPRQQPVLGGDIQHIIQSAGAAAQKSNRNVVSSALVLAAIVGDGRSPSAQMLRNQGMTFETAIAALKQANAADTAKPIGPTSAGKAPQPAPAAAPNPIRAPAVVPATTVPATTVPGTAVEGARLQNMQAAHEIIANARERIASARGAVANHTDVAKESPPERADPAQASPRPPQSTSPTAHPVEVAAPPAANGQATQPPQPVSSAPNPDPQQAAPSRTAPPAPRQPQPQPQPGPSETRMPQSAPQLSGGPQPVTINPAIASPQTAPAQPTPAPAATPFPAPPQQGPTAPLQSAQQYNPPPARPAGPVPQAPLPTAPPQPRRFSDVPPSGGRPPGSVTAAQGYDRPPGQSREPRTSRIQSSDLATVVRPIDAEALAEFIPTKMRIGQPTTIEIRAPRARLEAWSGGSSDPYERDGQVITKAMVMRLKAPKGGFTVEIASPETQWSEGFTGPLSDDVVSWRWIVTPKQRGRLPMLLNVSTRVVGRDGLAAARSLPEQLVTVRVAPNYRRIAGLLALWIFLAASGTALGYYGDRLFTMGSSMLARVMN